MAHVTADNSRLLDFSTSSMLDGKALLSQVVTSDRERFSGEYNDASFMFGHGLAGSPVLELAGLTELAARLAPRGGVYWSNGEVGIADRWEAGTATGQSLSDTLRDIAHNHSLVMLRFGVQDALVGPVLRRTLAELIDLTGPPLRDDVTYARATVLIASPHRITSYHVDGDTNFLFQIAGRKQFSVYPQATPPLLTALEVERYFCGDNNAARFAAARPEQAVVYDLGAGQGVHVPPLVPHWAQNGDEISIAVSFNFDLRSIDRIRHVHKVNARLRRLGLRPHAPDLVRLRDRGKLALVHLLDRRGGRCNVASRDGWDPSEGAP